MESSIEKLRRLSKPSSQEHKTARLPRFSLVILEEHVDISIQRQKRLW